MRRLSTLGLALGLLVTFGCSDDDPGADAGPSSRPDATSGDLDSGAMDPVRDASTEPDAGVDAGSPMDAGSGDAGTSCPVALTATATAILRVTADDQRAVFINGESVEVAGAGWSAPSSRGVIIRIHPSVKNTLAFEATNLYSINGFDRGLLAELVYTTTTAARFEVVTSTATRVATSSVAGWTTPEFEDTGWSTPVRLGTHGISPWGSVFGTSSAGWIWTYDPSGPASSKPNEEVMFARITFYVHRDGRLAPEPGPCP